ncbi:tyrosine-type recombinase/integrase [Fulvivirga sp. M361]|uniref:tyrosine-type recombinase/integrase n=1 Tax=Fulvivirga sp. M361 TaxID=2594266 RepID=UPI00117A2147|nr:site-specific integrase [Fulvivirga sp. M361]TRX46294.1 tyrosine-type recombinase/integrase [Fulvivirga sp. M361]
MSKIRLGKTADSRTRGKANKPIPADTENAFINYLLRKGYSARTAKSYQEDVNRFSAWINKENTTLEEIRYADVLHYVQSMRHRVDQSTISGAVNSLRHYFKHHIQQGTLTDNPTDQIEIKGVKKNRVYDVLEPLELEQMYHQFIITPLTTKHKLKDLEKQRDTVMLGLLVYQGITVQELMDLRPEDIKLRQGTIAIPGGRKSNSRELKLEAVQILDIQEYLSKTRNEILQAINKESEQLFVSIGASSTLYPTLRKFTNTIRKQTPRIKDLHQIRASVIVKWLKNYNLRQVQYMAGHRFVSSTEKYKLNDLRDLQEDINKFHPMG